MRRDLWAAVPNCQGAVEGRVGLPCPGLRQLQWRQAVQLTARSGLPLERLWRWMLAGSLLWLELRSQAALPQGYQALCVSLLLELPHGRRAGPLTLLGCLPQALPLLPRPPMAPQLQAIQPQPWKHHTLQLAQADLLRYQYCFLAAPCCQGLGARSARMLGSAAAWPAAGLWFRLPVLPTAELSLGSAPQWLLPLLLLSRSLLQPSAKALWLACPCQLQAGCLMPRCPWFALQARC